MLDLDFVGDFCVIKEKEKTPERPLAPVQQTFDWNLPRGKNLKVQFTDDGISSLHVEDQSTALALVTERAQGETEILRRTQTASKTIRAVQLREHLETSDIEHQSVVAKSTAQFNTAIAKKRDEVDRRIVASNADAAKFTLAKKKETEDEERKLTLFKATLAKTHAQEVESQEKALADRVEVYRSQQVKAVSKWTHDEAALTANREKFLHEQGLKQAETMKVLEQTAALTEHHADLAAKDVLATSQRQHECRVESAQRQAEASAAQHLRHLAEYDAQKEKLEQETELLRKASEISAQSRIEKANQAAQKGYDQFKENQAKKSSQMREQFEANRSNARIQHINAMERSRRIIR